MPNPREEEKWEAGLTVSDAQRRTEDFGGGAGDDKEKQIKTTNKNKTSITSEQKTTCRQLLIFLWIFHGNEDCIPLWDSPSLGINF